jgi:thiol-disulfide isomerase/thioredoxin
MKQKILLIMGIALFLLLMVGAYVLYNQLSPKVSDPAIDNSNQGGGEQKVIQAPDFTVYDLEGNEIHRSDFLGQPLVINFWATWCPYCIEELPDFEEVYQEMKEDVAFLMVDVADGQRETVEIASQYVEEQGFTFPVVYDTKLDALKQFGIRSFPTTVFVDKEGAIVFAKEGKLSKDALEKGIAMILGE